MNRRKVFSWCAALFAGGVAKAETLETCRDSSTPSCLAFMDGYRKERERRRAWKPGPNECPVCGTMAPPYKRSTSLITRKSDDRIAGKPCCDPMERITRCKRCNAAFWQDATE